MMSTLDSLNERTLSNDVHRSSLSNHHRTPARQPHHPKPPSRRAQRASSLSFSRPTRRPVKTLRRNLKLCHPKRFVRGVGRRWRGYWDCDGVYVGLDDWDLHEDGDGNLDDEGRGGGGGCGGKVKDGMRMVRSISKMGSRAMRSWSSASETSFTVTRPTGRSSSSSSTSTSSSANTSESSPASSRTSSATSLSSFKFKGKPTALFYKVTARLSLNRSLSNDFGVEGEERRQGWWTPARREEGW